MTAAEREPGEAAPPPSDPVVEGERISVTDVRGTIARFEMAYSPGKEDRFDFGPPLRARIPSFVFLGGAIVFAIVVAVGYQASSNSRLFQWVVEGDRSRPLSAAAFAFLLLASAVGTVIRAHMRGVIVHVDGIEARYILPMGIPRVRKWSWAQMHRLVIDEAHVMIEMWEGTYQTLPDVARPRELAELLERIAVGRGLTVTRLDRM